MRNEQIYDKIINNILYLLEEKVMEEKIVIPLQGQSALYWLQQVVL